MGKAEKRFQRTTASRQKQSNAGSYKAGNREKFSSAVKRKRETTPAAQKVVLWI